MPIDRNVVFSAADALVARGETVSVTAVRKEIGGGTPKGSPNTVCPLLRAWREAQVQIEAIPPEIEQAALQAIGSIWHVARTTAQRQYEGERIKWSEDLEVTTKDRDDAFNEIDRLETQISELRAALEKAQPGQSADNVIAASDTSKEVERLSAENERLRTSLHSAIRRPIGVVPTDADEFYDPRHPALARSHSDTDGAQ
ncbi:DNA-binding protein [Salipiger sp. PrR003]|uniref:DNA-binding protein n=1 Tax=Salipiger sp. PrR003 TaxID=2706776 RepID=UPI0013DAE1B2|nr:DNA-binding protein [Salipiger sp. PrR003]NDV50547.1 hypothetical protein [Salipiger sp. PrR003]